MLSAAAKAHKIANGVPDEEKENQEKQKRTSAMLKAMKAQADAKKKTCAASQSGYACANVYT